MTREAPNRAVTWYELGMAYRKAGATDMARAAFERTLAISPQHAPARQQLAELQAEPAATP